MKKRVMNYILGVLLIGFALTALYSDNPNVQTTTGKFMIILAGGFGTILLINTLRTKK